LALGVFPLRHMLLTVGNEHVAATTDSLNQAWRGRIGFENLPQTPDLHVDAAIGMFVFGTVQQVDQALA
jgi:hypothetical protein